MSIFEDGDGVEERIKADAAPVVGRVKTAVSQLLAGGLTASVFNFFQGRATTFGIVFLLMGVVFAIVAIWGFIHGKDLTGLASVISSMALFMGALQAITFAHSAKEDWNDYQQRKLDIQAQQVAAGQPIVPQQSVVVSQKNPD